SDILHYITKDNTIISNADRKELRDKEKKKKEEKIKEDFPEEASFTTLPVSIDTQATLRVKVTGGGLNVTVEKQITMLAQSPMGFDAAIIGNDKLQVLGEQPKVSSADLTGNGFNDIVVIGDGKISLLTHKGQSSDTVTDDYNLSTQINTAAVVMDLQYGDINNDGLSDMFVISGSTRQNLSWLINAPDNSAFVQENPFVFTGNVSSISAQLADLDGDGDLDVAVTYVDLDNSNFVALGWFEQTSVGGFASLAVIDPVVDNYTTSQSYLTVSDFNADGIQDIIVASGNGDDNRPVVQYINAGQAKSFSKTTAFYLTGGHVFASYQTADIQAADLNNDGLTDLISWQKGYFFGISSESNYHINQGDGTFKSFSLSSFRTSSVNLMSADIDGDGDNDIIHGNNGSVWYCDIGCGRGATVRAGEIFWQENVAGIIESDKKVLVNNDFGAAMTLVDVDNDGDLDVVNAEVGNGLWIIQNSLK
ncbi:MAG: VCBS repeat-containing protein, partial [Algicola sp.]|nr:VCBS repeat-containing protein [Algicola sp.]